MKKLKDISWVRFIYLDPLGSGKVITGFWWPADLYSEINFDELVSKGLLIDCEVV